jgi:hypothetical protein
MDIGYWLSSLISQDNSVALPIIKCFFFFFFSFYFLGWLNADYLWYE